MLKHSWIFVFKKAYVHLKIPCQHFCLLEKKKICLVVAWVILMNNKTGEPLLQTKVFRWT